MLTWSTKAFKEWNGTDVPSRCEFVLQKCQLFFFLDAVVSKFWERRSRRFGCLFAFFFQSTSPSFPQKKKEPESTNLIIMATDEELEAKKVNDTTPTDKAPEQPEKKKKDVATAILERKKAPNRLVVGEFFDFSFRRSLSR